MRFRGAGTNGQDLESGKTPKHHDASRGTALGTLRVVLLLLTIVAFLVLFLDMPATMSRRRQVASAPDILREKSALTVSDADGRWGGVDEDSIAGKVGTTDGGEESGDGDLGVTGGVVEEEKGDRREGGASTSSQLEEATSTTSSPSKIDEVKGPGKATATNAPMKGPALRLLVITYKRAESLKRLLNSLDRAEYYGDRIDLDVWIDMPSSGSLNADVVKVAEEHVWKFGEKTVHKRESNGGLRAQWHDTWDASVPGGLKEDAQERALILEDDLELSPFYWKWLKACHVAYAHRKDLAACSLQRAALCAADCPNLEGGPASATTNFMSPLVGSWGFSPTPTHWVRYTRWAKDFEVSGKKPYVEGHTPTAWYREFEKQGRCPGKNCMWTILHIKYVDAMMSEGKPQNTVYARCPNKQTLATNWQQAGLHYGGEPKKDHETLMQWDASLGKFPGKPTVLGWNGKAVSGYHHELFDANVK